MRQASQEFWLHAAALNLLIRLRRVVADPPSLTAADDRSGDAVPVADPTVPVEALRGEERRRYHRYRRQRDPLGQGHITTWRTMLIKVACVFVWSMTKRGGNANTIMKGDWWISAPIWRAAPSGCTKNLF